MADRTYDRILDCGCMISSDGGGGLLPCYAEYGDMRKKGKRLALAKHMKCWKKWEGSKDYQKHRKEVAERNQ